jgi:hypothetical protein
LNLKKRPPRRKAKKKMTATVMSIDRRMTCDQRIIKC